ncbi:MAG: hypothetical protein ACI8P0_002367 [Planctomycetaceae bacterium]|jgi:hypothetical protein
MLAALFSPGPSVANQKDADDRVVWEYSGGFGKSWFTDLGNKKWIIYLGNSTTVLNVEEERTPEFITLRSPSTRLWTRLHRDYGELRRTAAGSRGTLETLERKRPLGRTRRLAEKCRRV